MSLRFRLTRLAAAAFDQVHAAFRHREDPVLAPQHPPTRILEVPPVPAEECMALPKVRLAREYVEGVTLLVEVAAQHQTALPQAALRNLRYLSRLLLQAEEDLSPARRQEFRTRPEMEEANAPSAAVRGAQSS